jgi:Pectate lyase superfamily protein
MSHRCVLVPCGGPRLAVPALVVVLSVFGAAQADTPSPSAVDGAAASRATTAEFANVLDDQADPSGAADSTEAFRRAAARSSHVYAPCGTYRLNWIVSARGDFTFEGAGHCTTLEPATPGVDVITLSSGNFTELRDFALLNRSNGAGNGVTLTGGQGNTRLVNIYAADFSRGAGVNCLGTASAPLSGNDVVGGYFLNNRVGISYTQCHDYHIQSVQAGLNTSAGLRLDYASAGEIIDSFLWQNGVDADVSHSYYDTVSRDRITQADKQGLACLDCQYMNVEDNQFYQNSNSAQGKFEDVQFQRSAFVLVEGNNFFDWTNVARTSFALTNDILSSNFVVEGNSFIHHVRGEISIGGCSGLILRDNLLPTGAARDLSGSCPAPKAAAR